MTKQMKVIFYGLIILVAILAFLATFFFAKSRNVKTQTQSSPTPTSSLSSQAKSTPTPGPSQSTAVTKLASSTERPSNPSEIYTIVRGDSLLGISQTKGVPLDELSTANGITDSDKILVGQVIIIPQGNQIIFTVDNTKSTEIQKNVDNGRTLWRLSPDETARSDNAGAFGLSTTDVYTVKDSNDGQATVTVSKDGKNYLIKLTQPATKGDKGIWAIVSIAPAT